MLIKIRHGHDFRFLVRDFALRHAIVTQLRRTYHVNYSDTHRYVAYCH